MGSSAKPFIIVGKYGQHVVLLFHLTVSLGRGLKLQYSCHGGHFDKVISFLICIRCGRVVTDFDWEAKNRFNF